MCVASVPECEGDGEDDGDSLARQSSTVNEQVYVAPRHGLSGRSALPAVVLV